MNEFNKLLKSLIKGITSSDDLRELAKLLRVHIDGIYDISNFTYTGKGSYIILLRQDMNIGHWVAVHDHEYFDPFGIGPPQKIGATEYNRIQLQGDTFEYCGIYCLLWLYSKQRRRPDLMEGFKNLDVDIRLI